MKKKLLSLLLLCCMVLTLLPAAAFADEGEKAIRPVSEIKGYDSTTDSYNFIYFGKYNDAPLKWRVLDDKTNTGGDGLFLLSEPLLDLIVFNGSANNNWQGSNAQTWCKNFESSNLTAAEQAVILSTNKSDSKYTGAYMADFAQADNILANDKIFFLSAEEAHNKTYGFSDKTDRIAAEGTYWWLRSPASTESSFVGMVNIDGDVGGFPSYMGKVRARPALNLNKDNGSVLFVSAAEGGKAGSTGTLAAVGATTAKEWKLTLLDNSRQFIARTTAYDAAAKTVTVAYSGATAGEYVSAIIRDASGAITHYGRIVQSEKEDDTMTIDLSGIDMIGKTLFCFSEQYNGGESDNTKKTDYASLTVAVSLEKNAYAIHNKLTNLTSNNPATYRSKGDMFAYTATLSPVTGYQLPVSFTVKVSGGQPIYTYDKETGYLSIEANSITGDIEIEAAGVAMVYSIAADPTTADFGKAAYGYEQTAAKTVTIRNDGNQSITLTQPADTENYTVGALSGTTLAPNETATFTVSPRAGLTVGSYPETVTVSGSSDTSAEVTLSFIVEKAAQDAPAKPEMEKRTKTSITLKAIPANENGAAAEYRINDGEWQNSTEFTDLSYGTEYSFTARYKETDNYLASEESETAKIRTDSYGSSHSYHTITAAAGEGGSISPAGSVSAREGKDKLFVFHPDAGYAVSDVKIDGKSIGAASFYTFESIIRDHTIEVVFEKLEHTNPLTGAAAV